MDIGTLLKVKYAGQLDQTMTYTNIGVQAVSILIGGIVLWRVSNMIHQRKLAQRANQQSFQTRYAKHWRKRK